MCTALDKTFLHFLVQPTYKVKDEWWVIHKRELKPKKEPSTANVDSSPVSSGTKMTPEKDTLDIKVVYKTHTYMYTYTYTHTHMHEHTDTHVYTHTFMYTHTDMYTHKYTHTCTDTDIHT